LKLSQPPFELNFKKLPNFDGSGGQFCHCGIMQWQRDFARELESVY